MASNTLYGACGGAFVGEDKGRANITELVNRHPAEQNALVKEHVGPERLYPKVEVTVNIGNGVAGTHQTSHLVHQRVRRVLYDAEAVVMLRRGCGVCKQRDDKQPASNLNGSV